MNRKKNGETFVLEKSITPLRDATGQITHYISTGRDITDQRRLESQLQQAQKMDAIGRLAGGVAHDFNNLLMVISAYAELTLDALPADPSTREKVEEIIKAARRAADLTRQLLAFGRKQMQSLQLLDLNSVLREIGKMLPRLIGEDIQIVIVPGQDLDRVEADPVQIEQIVLNLAANARDAMPGGGKLTIETRNVEVNESSRERHPMMPAGDYVLLSVADSGMGIPQEHLAHIFEPFYTTKDEGKGTGLGLATVYGIVKQNGGFVWVNSEPDFGTSFDIYLHKAAGREAHQAATSDLRESPRGCETLLLVEDEGALRESAREFFVRRGYTVLAAANGEEAIQMSREYCGPIALMISDVVMPRMSGPNLAARLAAERPLMKVLFVSGYAESTILRHGKIEASACLLQKPFGLNTLASKVREVLGAKEAQARSATNAG
jgi:two-component system, cell cycle sensor histidine kinase and response regulator CckA